MPDIADVRYSRELPIALMTSSDENWQNRSIALHGHGQVRGDTIIPLEHGATIFPAPPSRLALCCISTSV